MRHDTRQLYEKRARHGAQPQQLAWFCSAAVADFCAAVDTAMRDAYRAAVPDMGFIFVAPARSNRTAVRPLSDYRDALYEWCLDQGHEFYNMYDDWPDYAAAHANGQWADSAHVAMPGGGLNTARRITELFHLI